MNKIDKSKFLDADRLTQIALGNVKGHTLITKFGRNANVGTTFVPVTSGGQYYTPTTAIALEVLSTSADDDIAGTGARKIKIIGIGSDWLEKEVEIELSGLTAAVIGSFTRIYRAYFTEMGTYSVSGNPGQVGTISIREVATPANVWLTIPIVGGLGMGQSQIGVYTVPKGKTGIVLNKNITMDTGKSITIGLFSREGCDIIVAPFTPRKVREVEEGLDVPFNLKGEGYLFKVTGPADVGFMAKVGTGTAVVSCDFQILEIDNEYL